MTVDEGGGLSVGLAEPAYDYGRLIAQLSAEPFNKSFAEVARMTDAQIFDVLLRPRDPETGEILPESEGGGLDVSDVELTPEECEAFYFGMGRSLGVDEGKLRAGWEAKRAATAGAAG